MKRLSPTPPRSPLTTHLSGSARETELRIRSIFQWKKSRPPVWLMAGVGALILLCGSLVSCRVQASAPPQGPEFALTQAGTETVPFENLLGYRGTVTHTISYGQPEQYVYQITLADKTDFTLADVRDSVYHLDLNSDGDLELVNSSQSGRLTVFQRWPDGSIRSQELSQAAGELLGIGRTGWEQPALTFHPEDRTVTVQTASGQVQVCSLSQLLEAAHTGEIVLPADHQPPEEGTSIVFCDRANLDGQGGEDDSAVVTSRPVDNAYGGQTVLEVTLGSGDTLRWSENSGTFWPVLSPAYLTTPNRQCLVLELDSRTSNYGAALYTVLEVADGKLEEIFSLDWENPDGFMPVYGAYVRAGADGLQELRLPDLWDKWHAPAWSTLAWPDQAQPFQLVSDGYFTDLNTVTVEGNRTLTLELRGRRSAQDGPYGRTSLYYDQVRVWENGRLLQTILPQFPLPASNAFDADTLARTTIPSGNYNPLGFEADASLHAVYVQDMNFDGSGDLGLPCDTTHSDMHAWYLWNPARDQFEYAFALAGQIDVDEDNQQLIEHPFRSDGPETAAYSFNAYGQLVWTGSPEE